jgi:AraC-like DNA-binding protein
VEAIAKRFSIDRRSILRRLKSEGTTYSDLLKQVRSELLEHYIENTNRSLTEIARLLGFASISALSRWKRSQPHQSQTEEPSVYNDTFWIEGDMYFDAIYLPEPTRKPRK